MPIFDRIKNWIFKGSDDIDVLVKKKDFKQLVRALEKGKDMRMKMLAAETLGNLGDPRAFEPLSKVLSDSDFFTCSYVGEALAKVGGERAVPVLLNTMISHNISPLVVKESLKILKEKAFPVLLDTYRKAQVKFDLAGLLIELDCAEATMDIKRDFDRNEFSAHDTSGLKYFLEKHKDRWTKTETVRCLVCNKEGPVHSMKGSGELWFCPDPCWKKRGKLLSRGIGKNCPLYLDGFCKAGSGESFCSLEVGDYAIDCYVYPIEKK